TTAIFNSWITKDVRLTVPETVKVLVRGSKPDNVTAKDFMLEVLRQPYVKSGRAIGKLVEYCGDAVESLSVDERATMTNMTAEVGGFTGYVAPDAKTVDFLMECRGMARGEAGGAVVHPVRIAGREALLRGAGLPRVVPEGRCDVPRAVVRCLYQRGARRVENAGRSDDQRDQPQLPGPLGSGATLPRQPVQ